MSPPPLLHTLSHATFLTHVETLAAAVQGAAWRPDFLVGVGRGGLVPAVYLSHRLDLPMLSIDHSAGKSAFADDLLTELAGMSRAGNRLLLVDDINDSGGTIMALRSAMTDRGCVADLVRFAVLIDNIRSNARVDYAATRIDRAVDKSWFVFPWEAVATRDAIVEEARSAPHRLA